MRILNGIVFGLLLAGSVFAGNASPAKPLQKIVYVKTGPRGPTEQFTVDLKGKTITYEFSNDEWDIGKKNYKKWVVDRKKTEKILAKLSGFTGKQWKDRYSDPEVRDGTFWRLYLTFADGSVREITGANAWPKNFRDTLCLREIWSSAQ